VTGPRLGSQRQQPYRRRMTGEDHVAMAVRMSDPHPYCIFTYEHCTECLKQDCKYRGCKP